METDATPTYLPADRTSKVYTRGTIIIVKVLQSCTRQPSRHRHQHPLSVSVFSGCFKSSLLFLDDGFGALLLACRSTNKKAAADVCIRQQTDAFRTTTTRPPASALGGLTIRRRRRGGRRRVVVVVVVFLVRSVLRYPPPQ